MSLFNYRVKLFVYTSLVLATFLYTPINRPQLPIEKVKKLVSKNLIESGEFKEQLDVAGKTYHVDFTVQKKYQEFLDKLLRRHYSDYAVAVVIDNDNGEVIGLGSYSLAEKRKVPELAFQTTHPSASLIKIVSIANLIENSKLKNSSDIYFQGRGTTLYKYQLKDDRRWRRKMSLKKAFAFSNNPAIAKATIKYSVANDFIKTANKFGFNKEFTNFVELPQPKLPVPQNQYNFAEISSGFTTETLTNPIQAAYMPFLIANNGVGRKLKLIEKVVAPDGLLHQGLEDIDAAKPLFDETTVAQLKHAMESVVERGTASRLRRRLRRNVKKELTIGGKTGTLTGGEPYGRRDWFAGYAIPKDGSSKGISFAVMHINQKKWYVRSTFIAKNIIEYYYRQYKNDRERIAYK